MKSVALWLAAFVAIQLHAAEVIPPKPTAYFNDYAGVVSKNAASRFNQQLAQFERDTSNQVVVAVFPKMQSDDDSAAYAQRVAHSWGVGQKEKRNGIVLLVFVADHKTSIQVGYGLEGALPDITAFDIRENHINPRFRKGDYEGGLADGIDSICKAIRGEYQGTGKTVRDNYQKQERNMLAPNLLLFLFFAIFLFFVSRLRRSGYHYSSGGGGWGGWSVGGGASDSGWSSSDSGGGFSGGGGDFGGGGSSGSW